MDASSVNNEPPHFLLLVRDTYPPFRVDLTELFSRYLVRHFLLDWIMDREEAGPQATIQHGPQERFYVLRKSPGGGLRSRISDIISSAGLKFRLAVAAARGTWDLVQARDVPLLALAFLTAARIGRVPFVYWMSFPIVESYRYRAERDSAQAGFARTLLRYAYASVAGFVLYRLVMPHCSHVFVQSELMRDDMVRKGLARDMITPVPMGVNTEVYTPDRIPPAADARLEGRKVITYLGSLDRIRRLDVAIEALQQILASGHDAVLVLVGGESPADIERLNEVGRAAGVLERMIFTGHLPLPEALAYVRRADVCLSPVPTDPLLLPGTPTKLVEYLALGRPVVANPHPDQINVITSSGAGLIVDLHPAAFANAICTLLDNPIAAECMAARGPDWVARHRSYRMLSDVTVNVYRRLLSSNAAKR